MNRPNYSIVIPCHNEALTIEETVENLLAALVGETDFEIVLIDNLSSDGTWDVLADIVSRHEVVSSYKSPNRAGYGVAIKEGIRSSRGNYVVFVMADGSEEPVDVLNFISVSRSNPEACIFGNRFSESGSIQGYPLVKLLVNRVANFALRVMFKTMSGDLTNGFKLYPRALIGTIPLESEDFSITVELSLGAICSGAKVIEVPNKWRGREAGESSFSLLKLAVPYAQVALRAYRACQARTKGPSVQ